MDLPMSTAQIPLGLGLIGASPTPTVVDIVMWCDMMRGEHRTGTRRMTVY